MESAEFIRLLVAGLFGGGLTVFFNFLLQLFKDRNAAKLEVRKVDNADDLDNRKFDASLRDELRRDLTEAKQIYRDTVVDLRKAEARALESERLADECRVNLEKTIEKHQESEKRYQESERLSSEKIKTLTDALTEEQNKRRKVANDSRRDYEKLADQMIELGTEVEKIKEDRSTESKP